MRWLLAAFSLIAALLWPTAASALSSEDYKFNATLSSSPAAASAPAGATTVDQGHAELATKVDELYERYRRWQDQSYLMIIALLTIVTLAFEFVTVWLSTRAHSHLSGKELLRVTVVIFIAYGSVVLALAYPEPQVMTGVVGILGSIAGYVFGRSGSDDQDSAARRAASERTGTT